MKKDAKTPLIWGSKNTSNNENMRGIRPYSLNRQLELLIDIFLFLSLFN